MATLTHRYGRVRTKTASAADVYNALTEDEWASGKIAEVYRKVFEGEGTRKGSSPDHFLYVTPSKARSEINELGSWISERFGDPADTVPKKTPFGYLSVRYDGWMVYFAAMICGPDESLVLDFLESVADMSWASATSRNRSANAGSVPAVARPSVEAPSQAASAASSTFGSSFTSPYPQEWQSARPAASSAASITTPPSFGENKPGFFERFVGVKESQPVVPSAPTPTAQQMMSRPSPRPKVVEVEVPDFSDEPLSEEEEAEARELFQRATSGKKRGMTAEEELEELRIQRAVDLHSLRAANRVLSDTEKRLERNPLPPKKRTIYSPESVESAEKESAAQEVRALAPPSDIPMALARAEVQREEAPKKSTVEQLKRPPGTGFMG